MSAVTPAIAPRAVRVMEPIDRIDCIICGSRVPAGRPVVVAAPPERPFALHRCDTCGVVQQFPRWAGARIRAHGAKPGARTNVVGDQSWTDAVQAVALLSEVLATPQGRRLLDVGCGGGHLAALAKALGWRVTGLDHDPDAVSRAAVDFGLDVRAGELSSHFDTFHPFDVVLIRGTLETAAHPQRLLSDARKVLSAGGILCIDTLNADHFLRGWYASRGDSLPPSTVNLFAADNLSTLVADLGFKDLDVRLYSSIGRESRPILRSLLRWLPAGWSDRIVRFFNWRGARAEWSPLRNDPPRSLEEARHRVERYFAAPPVTRSSCGDRLVLLARR